MRRELSPGDADAIVALHDRVYSSEYGLDGRFAATISWSVQAAVSRGWPERGGAAWIVDRQARLEGCLALTDEGSGVGRVRWFVLAPAIRGGGLGRRLMAELVSEASEVGLARLALETFSALSAAARIYRDLGFAIRWQRETDGWGPPITLQGYELELR